MDRSWLLVWDKLPFVAREMKNSKSSLDNQDFVTKAVFAEVTEACTVLALPSGVLPTLIYHLGVVPKSNSDKLRLIVNLKYVNERLVKRVS